MNEMHCLYTADLFADPLVIDQSRVPSLSICEREQQLRTPNKHLSFQINT
jgi:hypothetical protein